MSHRDGRDDGRTRGTTEVEELEADIARTREELAQTIDQLTARLDVKSRAKDRIARIKDKAAWEVQFLRSQAMDEDGRPRPAALAGAGGMIAGLAAVAAVAMWRRNVRARNLPWSARMAARAQVRAEAAAATAAAAREQARGVLETAAGARSDSRGSRSPGGQP